MPLIIEAIYENGVLKPAQPLPLKEREKVRVTVEPALTCAERSAGMMGWKGSAEEAEHFAMSAELEFPSPEEDQ
jgi:predicted DNA-binding antitoxin AbrB/MazE fold protein